MKRGRASYRSDAMVSIPEGEQGFWPSYADMMSAVALILFFLMLLSYIQNLVTGNDLQNTQEALKDTKVQLAVTESDVEEAQALLKMAEKSPLYPKLLRDAAIMRCLHEGKTVLQIQELLDRLGLTLLGEGESHE